MVFVIDSDLPRSQDLIDSILSIKRIEEAAGMPLIVGGPSQGNNNIRSESNIGIFGNVLNEGFLIEFYGFIQEQYYEAFLIEF